MRRMTTFSGPEVAESEFVENVASPIIYSNSDNAEDTIRQCITSRHLMESTLSLAGFETENKRLSNYESELNHLESFEAFAQVEDFVDPTADFSQESDLIDLSSNATFSQNTSMDFLDNELDDIRDPEILRNISRLRASMAEAEEEIGQKLIWTYKLNKNGMVATINAMHSINRMTIPITYCLNFPIPERVARRVVRGGVE